MVVGRLLTTASVSTHSRPLCLSIKQYGRLEEGEEEWADSEVSSLITMESRSYFRDPQKLFSQSSTNICRAQSETADRVLVGFLASEWVVNRDAGHGRI